MPGFSIPSGEPDGPGPSASSLTETARKHRWTLDIEASSPPSGSTMDALGGVGAINKVTIFAHKATRPSPEIDSVTVHHSQDEIYFPGKNRWAPIEITFYEVFNNNGNETAFYIYNWWSKSVINLRSSRIATGPIKRRCILTQIDGMGTPTGIYKYTLHGCWPEKVTPDDFDYTDSAIGEITIRLRFDKCTEEMMGGPQEFEHPDKERIDARREAEAERIRAAEEAAAHAASPAGRRERQYAQRRAAQTDNAIARAR